MILTRLRETLVMLAAAATIQGAVRSRRTIRAGDKMLLRKGQMDGTLSGIHLHLARTWRRNMSLAPSS
eukprot:1832366-Amphidinium_carterae.1